MWNFANDSRLQRLREDHLFEQILYSSCAELEEARLILQNIVRRRLYKCLGQTCSKRMEVVSPVGDGVLTRLPLTRPSDTVELLMKIFVPLKETRRCWEAELARTTPESGASNKHLAPEDFVVKVSFTREPPAVQTPRAPQPQL